MMKVSLNENIRSYRKGMSLTQEQLADAMGVSVATVSKWEGGTVSPDVEMLAELADFFQTSVDVLLGYQWRKRSMGQYVEELKRCYETCRYEEGKAEARKAVQRFPYSFPVLYWSGMLLFVASMKNTNGTFASDETVTEDMGYAKELLNRALGVFEQNEDKSISRESIHQVIGNIYGFLGDKERAVEYLEEYNICNVNDQMLGVFYSYLGEYEKAKEYSYRNFQRNLLNVWSGLTSVFNVLVKLEKYDDILRLAQWTKEFCYSVADENSSYFERCGVLVDALIVSAYVHKAEKEHTDYRNQIEEHLRYAMQAAVHFEEHPDYTGKLKFFEVEEKSIHDSFGGSAMDVLKNTLLLHKHNKKQYQQLSDIFNRVCGEMGLVNENLK